MKISLLLSLIILMAGCSSTPPKHIRQIEIGTMQTQGFCRSSKLTTYMETDYYYSFTCGDGTSFFLPKKD